MLTKPKECDGCVLNFSWNGFSNPEGTGKNRILIVGESLGEKEKHAGKPFVRDAESGSVLETALRLSGLRREDFVLWNMIGCQPPANKLENTSYETEAINHCKVHFESVINKFKPSVFLALGSVPFKYLTGTHGSIGGITINRGYLFDSIYRDIKVVPSLHPSFINRKLRKHIPVLIRDIKRAIEVSRGQYKELDTSHYILKPDNFDISDFIDYAKKHPDIPISYDIETSYSKLEAEDIESNQDVREITQIQFQIGKHMAIVFDWPQKMEFDFDWGDDDYKNANLLDTNPELLDNIKEILGLPNPKIGWNNWLFDSINLEYHLGKDIVKGQNLDLMWAWHHWQPDIKWPGMKLQFVTNIYEPNFPAWKHLATTQPDKYGLYDVDSVSRIYDGLIKDLKAPKFRHKNLFTGIESKNSKSLYEGYIDDVVKLWPILRKMSDRGLPIDLVARAKFRDEIKKQIEESEETIQKLYPFHLRKTEHEEGYKYVPKEVNTYTEEFKNKIKLNRLYNTNNKPNISNIYTSNDFLFILDKSKIQSLINEYIELNTRKEGMSGLILKEFRLKSGAKEYRWDRVEYFKAGSPKQLIKYIEYKGYKVPTKRSKTGEFRPTTDKEHIHKLWEQTGDKLFEYIILKRELDKMLSTYIGESDYNLYEENEYTEEGTELRNKIDKETGWPIGKDGRVHSTFIFEPATGQLSSTRPNVQNPPKRGNQFSSRGYKKLAEQFRTLIAAPEGKVILEIDFSGFHALMLGFEAEDELYMRLARLGIHDYVASHMIKRQLPNRWLKIKRNKIKSEIEAYERDIEFYKDLDSWINLSDFDLKTKLSYTKKHHKFVRDAQAKPAVHGIGFGEGVNKLFTLNRNAFTSKQEVQELHDLMLITLFPKIKTYQDKIRALADKQKYLVTRFGYIRWFYDVYDWRIIPNGRAPKPGEYITRDNEGKWWSRKSGMDSEAVIAYLPSNNAFGLMKEKMRILEELGYNDKYELINQVHDSLMFLPDEDLLDEAIRNMVPVMSSATKHLINDVAPNGLHCLVEASFGPNWASMKDYEL